MPCIFKTFTGTRKAKVYQAVETISWEDKKHEDTNCSFHYGSGMSMILLLLQKECSHHNY